MRRFHPNSKAEHTVEKISSSFTSLSDRDVSSCTFSLRQKVTNISVFALFQKFACGESSPDKQCGSYDELSTPFERSRLARQLLLVAKSPLAFSPLYIWLPRSLFLTIQNFYKNFDTEQCLREWYWQKSWMDLNGIKFALVLPGNNNLTNHQTLNLLGHWFPLMSSSEDLRFNSISVVKEIQS